jgi:hypothetical protein
VLWRWRPADDFLKGRFKRPGVLDR